MKFRKGRALATAVAVVVVTLVASGCRIAGTATTRDTVLSVEYDGGMTGQSAFEVTSPAGPRWVTPTGLCAGPYELVNDQGDVIDTTTTSCADGVIVLKADVHATAPYRLAPTSRPTNAAIDGTPVTLRPDGSALMVASNPAALAGEPRSAVGLVLLAAAEQERPFGDQFGCGEA